MDIKGLSEKEAKERLEKYGLNEITHKKRHSLISIFISQFTDIFSILLILAILISIALYVLHRDESLADAVLILLILLANGLIGTFQQWKAEETLEKLRALQKSYVNVIRDGQVKKVESKYITVGDIVVLEEGVKVPADAVIVQGGVTIDESTFTGESYPVTKSAGEEVFAGTFVVGGKAFAEVQKIGNQTRMGELSRKISEIEEISVFKSQLNEFSLHLLRMVLAVMFVFFAVSYFKTHAFVSVLLASIALVVAVVPEGLPMVAAITMMSGVQKLAKKNVLVKKLESVEALGAVEYVIFDKTGTLTEGTLIADYVSPKLKKFLAYFPIQESLDPVEKAVANAAQAKPKGKRLKAIPFDYTTKRSSVIWEIEGKEVEFTKGAPEVIFTLVGKEDKQAVALAKNGLRVLAFAKRVGRRWSYLGLVGFKDPLKPSAKQALEAMKKAHLIPIMITGDHKETALAIARELGIKQVALHGKELKKNPALAGQLMKGGVVYRAQPEDKLLVVEALQKRGHIVASTGDGVNDVLLLKRADVGIAMGRGTDIAKDAADIVLLKDDLLTIVNGILEGRVIITNVRKFITFLLSSNIAEVVCAFFVPFMSTKIVLDAPKLLWVNLLSDGIPATMFAFDEGLNQIKNKKPTYFRKLLLPFMQKIMIFRGTGTGLLLCLFFFFISQRLPFEEASALFFSGLALGEVICLFVTRYLFGSGLFDNKLMLLSIIGVFALHLLTINTFPELFGVSALSPLDYIILLTFLGIDLLFSFAVAEIVRRWEQMC